MKTDNWYYFTDAETAEQIDYDFVGTIDEALDKARLLAKENNIDIIINNAETDEIEMTVEPSDFDFFYGVKNE